MSMLLHMLPGSIFLSFFKVQGLSLLTSRRRRKGSLDGRMSPMSMLLNMLPGSISLSFFRVQGLSLLTSRRRRKGSLDGRMSPMSMLLHMLPGSIFSSQRTMRAFRILSCTQQAYTISVQPSYESSAKLITNHIATSKCNAKRNTKRTCNKVNPACLGGFRRVTRSDIF